LRFCARPNLTDGFSYLTLTSGMVCLLQTLAVERAKFSRIPRTPSPQSNSAFGYKDQTFRHIIAGEGLSLCFLFLVLLFGHLSWIVEFPPLLTSQTQVHHRNLQPFNLPPHTPPMSGKRRRSVALVIGSLTEPRCNNGMSRI